MPISVNLGDIGTISIADQLLDSAKTVLERRYNLTGTGVTNADYKDAAEQFILEDGWEPLKNAITRQAIKDYMEAHPIPDVSQYLSFTPA